MDEHKTPEEIINDNAAPDALRPMRPKRARSRKKSRPASPPPAKPILPKSPLRRRQSP